MYPHQNAVNLETLTPFAFSVCLENIYLINLLIGNLQDVNC